MMDAEALAKVLEAVPYRRMCSCDCGQRPTPDWLAIAEAALRALAPASEVGRGAFLKARLAYIAEMVGEGATDEQIARAIQLTDMGQVRLLIMTATGS